MSRYCETDCHPVYANLVLAHQPGHAADDVFEKLKGYPMRAYSLTDDAKNTSGITFDYHVDMQETNYLKDHGAAKMHGKTKTVNLRPGFQVHLLQETRQKLRAA